MNGRMLQFHRAQRGVTLIELLVALAVFALFILMIDAVFSGARKNTRKIEIAADAQQNARVAVERLTRELRETRATEIRVDNATLDHSRIVFKSARLKEDNAVFCLYVRTNSEPLYDARCFATPGPQAPAPPYGTPPFASAPCNGTVAPNDDGRPCQTYTPLWQRYIGYYLVDTPGDGLHELRRVVGDLAQPDPTPPDVVPDPFLPDPVSLTGGDVIATQVESFNVSLTGGTVAVRLKVKGSEVVQGRAVPPQEILLPGEVTVRN